MVTLFLIIVAISLLILVHEWGHFYSARRLGVRVEEFGFGFPPRLFSRVKNGIRYSFNALPLGGFVKIFGEHGEGEDREESFIARPIWQRFVILSAGVFMNFFAAWTFFTAGAAIGVPGLIEESEAHEVPVSIVAVIPGSPAEQAGIKLGDAIIEMRAHDLTLTVESEKDVKDFIDAYRGEEIRIVVRRNGEIREFGAVPRVNVPEGEGPLGIAMGRVMIQKVPWYLAPIEGLKNLAMSTLSILYAIESFFIDIVIKGKVSADVAGPVGIFFFADDLRSLGIAYFIQFLGILSVNLAVLNFLPIPALDGGRVLFLVIEKIRGKRINQKFENAAHSLGFILLIALMIIVTYRDIARVF